MQQEDCPLPLRNKSFARSHPGAAEYFLFVLLRLWLSGPSSSTPTRSCAILINSGTSCGVELITLLRL